MPRARTNNLPAITLFTFSERAPILGPVSNFSFTATYYFGFFGDNRWGPRSRVQ